MIITVDVAQLQLNTNQLLNIKGDYMKVKFIFYRDLLKVFGELSTKEFGFRRNLAIARFNANVLQKDFYPVELERIKIAQKFAEKSEDGQPIIENGSFKIPEDKRAEFTKSLEELLTYEVESDFEPFVIEELEKVNLSGNSVILLEASGFLK